MPAMSTMKMTAAMSRGRLYAIADPFYGPIHGRSRRATRMQGMGHPRAVWVKGAREAAPRG